MRTALIAGALLLAACACGPIGGSSTPAPSAASVAIKSGDLPSGMTRCDQSGDIGAYLKKIQTKDRSTYSAIKTGWDAAQKNGATAGDVEFYADSTAHCSNLASNTTEIGTATYKLVVNFEFQFKDQASAEAGYKSDSALGFGASSLKSSQLATEGVATGLGANSVVLAVPIGAQIVYLAVWQNKQFLSIIGIFNIDAATDKKIALAVTGRIH
jgi:hypothetical protein